MAKFDISATIAMIGIADLRTEGEDQNGQQDDRGAGADDAAYQSRDVADGEDKGVGHHDCVRRSCIGLKTNTRPSWDGDFHASIISMTLPPTIAFGTKHYPSPAF